jgi:hypothetical protein
MATRVLGMIDELEETAAPIAWMDFDAGPADPTVLLVLRPGRSARWLRSVFDSLAEAEVGTCVPLDAQIGVVLRDPLMSLVLCLVDDSRDGHLARRGTGDFTWSATSEEWSTAGIMIEPLLQGSGHQYLTDKVNDDAVIEVSVGEHFASDITRE